MNEYEFYKAYQNRQNTIHATDSLKSRVLTASQTLEEKPTTVSDTEKMRTAETMRTHPRQPKQQARNRSSRKPWYFAAVACFLAIGLGLGFIPFAQNEGEAPLPLMHSNFAVKAYAAERNKTLELSDEGNIIFERPDIPPSGLNDDDEYLNAGYFTGCLISIEGENITRIQASLSSGELYRQTYEEFIKSDDPARWQEVLNWKDTKRGSGTYYSAYDYVDAGYINDGTHRSDPNKAEHVDLLKRLGSVIDTPYTANTYLGFWTNKPLGDYSLQTDLPFDAWQARSNALIDVFDKEKLTVTAEFEDGHYETQVIELHAADMKAEIGTGTGNAQGLHILPEIIDTSLLSSEELEQTSFIHSLYGVVIEANDQPFPFSLEHANERMNIVDDPLVLPECVPPTE